MLIFFAVWFAVGTALFTNYLQSEDMTITDIMDMFMLRVDPIHHQAIAEFPRFYKYVSYFAIGLIILLFPVVAVIMAMIYLYLMVTHPWR